MGAQPLICAYVTAAECARRTPSTFPPVDQSSVSGKAPKSRIGPSGPAICPRYRHLSLKRPGFHARLVTCVPGPGDRPGHGPPAGGRRPRRCMSLLAPCRDERRNAPHCTGAARPTPSAHAPDPGERDAAHHGRASWLPPQKPLRSLNRRKDETPWQGCQGTCARQAVRTGAKHFSVDEKTAPELRFVGGALGGDSNPQPSDP